MKTPKQISKFPKKLPGTFWGITTIFNPQRYKNKVENYRKFRESSKRQGLKLLTVELAFGKNKFELNSNDADILIQLRSNTVLWQKERLLNIGLENLPKDCDKIAWVDSDIIFCRDDWIKETSRLLELYNVVQPYSFVSCLSKNGLHLKLNNFLNYSLGYINAKNGVSSFSDLERIRGHPGYAWAARKFIFDKHGFYDKTILGEPDVLMAGAFYGLKLKINHNYDVRFIEDLSKDVKGSVYYTDGKIKHLWHGNLKNRYYGFRTNVLRKHKFDFNKDIKLDENGCWTWASDKPKLHKDVERFFKFRNEERSFLISLLSFRWKPWAYYLIVNKYIGKFGILLRRILNIKK